MNILLLGKIGSGKSTMLKNIKANIISSDVIVSSVYEKNGIDKKGLKEDIISGDNTIGCIENLYKDMIMKEVKDSFQDGFVNIVEGSYCSYLDEFIKMFDFVFEVASHSDYLHEVYNREGANSKLIEMLIVHQDKNYITSKDFYRVNSDNLLETIAEVALVKHTRIDLKMVKDMYNEYGRYYHNWNHIMDILSRITLTDVNLLATIFHDIVYDPRASDVTTAGCTDSNEILSATFYAQVCKQQDNAVVSLIESTADLSSITELAILDRAIL